MDNLTYGEINHLDYNYATYDGNKVLKITDSKANSTSSDLMEFKQNSTSNQYDYDVNGRLTKDLNKKISGIQYNYLHLPKQVDFTDGRKIEYVYDASGVKLQTKHTKPGESPTTTDYFANRISEDGVLKMIRTEEGYAVPNGSNGFNRYYYIKDHLGNNRVVMNENGGVEQVTNYYPFGTTFAENPARTDQDVQRFKFGGKELDRMFGLDMYDFEARMYSPVLGRFMQPDPMAEKYYSVSPYAYCANNPIKYVDPDGRDVWELDEYGKIIQRIEDKTQDAFYMVSKDADGNYQRTYTIDADGNKNYNSISFEYGTVTSVQEKSVKTDAGEQTLTMFSIKGDEKATQVFEFMANPEVTTKVEWSHDKIGTEKSEKNIVGTMHHESKTAQGYYLMKKGYTIREDNHSHPRGTGPSPADFRIARDISAKNKNASFGIYTGKGKYTFYAP